MAKYLALVALLLPLAACASDQETPTTVATVSRTATSSPVAATPGTKVTASPTVSTPASPTVKSGTAPEYASAAFEIEGRRVELVDGVAEVEAAPGSASKVTTRYFGNAATGDLNGDGTADAGFILTQSPGGSGTFYFAVAALRTADGWKGTNAVLLGDRIAPQSTQIENGTLIVNFAERLPGEPMTARPSVGVTKRLRVAGDRLTE
jgi:hypothetical protein